MTEPVLLLKLSGVAKSFGGVRALKGVDFNLKPGEVHALLGENGAGKSTLIKIITGAHPPDEGTIEVGGVRRTKLTPASARQLGIACIYQQPALFPDLSVAENIWLRVKQPRASHCFSRVEADRLAHHWLKEIGARLDPASDVSQLSMAEQQWVELACALGTGARVLIMDEPTASLTRADQERLFERIHHIRQSGVGIIYISHRLEEIFALTQRVTVLRDGQSCGTFSLTGQSGAAEEPITGEKLIQLMVGHQLESPAARVGKEFGPVALSLRQLSHQASGVGPIDLEIRGGEIVGLAGLVGSGRTELSRVLFGLEPADGGLLQIFGREQRIDNPQQALAAGIGLVPEDRRRHGVILPMTVSENLTLSSFARVFPGGWIRRRAEADWAGRFIESLRIKTSGAQSAVESLSGGNQQKVALGRWLGRQPRILILDEPTQGVDVGAKQEFHQLIQELAKKGMAVLLISSDLPELLLLADRIVVMRQGRLAESFVPPFAPERILSAALGMSRQAA